MRNFLAFVLTLALAFSGVMIFSHVPKVLTAPRDLGMGRTANLTSLAIDSNVSKHNGIELKILGLDHAIPIPNKRLGSGLVGLRVEITNKTSTNIQAGYENLTPELVGQNGLVLPLQRIKNERWGPLSVCQVVRPGQHILFLPGKLSWNNNKLQLKDFGGHSEVRYFDDLQPGTYQLRFIYESPGGTISCKDRETQQIRILEGLGTGRGVTTFLPLRIIQPVAINSTTVEVDGIWFETVIQERVLPIPANKPDATTPMPVGIRITNKTSTPRFFSYFDTLFPEIIEEPSGKRIQWEGGRAGSGGRECPSVQPGKSVTFFWNAKLSWENNLLQLQGSDGFNSSWQFNDLKPGRYQIGISYLPDRDPVPLGCNDTHTSSTATLRHLSGSMGVNPNVEVRLVQRSDVWVHPTFYSLN